MIVRTLQPRFTVRGTDGKLRIIPGKIGTIRLKPWTVGRTYDIRIWTGLPYRSKQEHVAFVTVANATEMLIPSEIMAFERLYWDAFAVSDGFKDWPDMRAWFDKTHGLPCAAWHMRWREVTV